MSHAADPTAVAYAREKRAAGWSFEMIAKDMTATGFPITGMTVMRWCRADVAAVPTIPKPPKKPRAKPGGCTCKRVRGQKHYPSCATHAIKAADAAKPKPIDNLKASLQARKEAAAAAPAPDDAADADAEGSTLDTFRRMLANTLADIEAQRVSNPVLAGKLVRDASNLANTISRMEGRAVDDADVLRISRADIKSLRDKERERVKSLLDRPLLCSECNRALSVRWSGGDD